MWGSKVLQASLIYVPDNADNSLNMGEHYAATILNRRIILAQVSHACTISFVEQRLLRAHA